MKRRRGRPPKKDAAPRAHPYSWLKPLKARPPSPFFDSGRNALADRPETALLCAVLEDALACLDDAAHPELEADARRWFFSGPSRSVFSFLALCEALELDAGYIRESLRLRLNARPGAAAKRGKDRAPRSAAVKWPGGATRPFGGK